MEDINKVMEYMEAINYGWFDINNQIHINTIENIQSLYRLSTIDEIMEHKVGICFDQVELERYFFDKYYKTNSYAIITNHMVHTFLTLEKDNRFIYFEHSSFKNKGIYYFDNIDELLTYVIKSFMNNQHIKNINKLKLVSYEAIKPMSTFEEIKEVLLTKNNNRIPKI